MNSRVRRHAFTLVTRVTGSAVSLVDARSWPNYDRTRKLAGMLGGIEVARQGIEVVGR